MFSKFGGIHGAHTQVPPATPVVSLTCGVAVHLELSDYTLELPLPLEPELRAMVDNARAEQYLKDMRDFLEGQTHLADERKVVNKQDAVFRKSNAHFANVLDKGLRGMGVKLNA